MTVDELIADLSRMPGEWKVVIEPRHNCCAGYPQWLTADVATDDDEEVVRVYLGAETNNDY